MAQEDGHHIQWANSNQPLLGFRTGIYVNCAQHPAPQNPLALEQHLPNFTREAAASQGAWSSLSAGGST